MTREQQARRRAAEAIAYARARRRYHPREEPYQMLRRVAEDLANCAGHMLAGHLRGGDRDEYGNALECAEIEALAFDLLDERSRRLLHDRLEERRDA